MLMIADVGEEGVPDLLMSAKKSCINLAKIRISTEKYLKMYLNITVFFFITSGFSYNIFLKYK